MNRVDLRTLKEIAEIEFADIVAEAFILDINELRLLLYEGSFVDVWFSLKLDGRYSYQWERRSVDGTIYRHDNAPHKHWEAVATFPKHFHYGSETNVKESQISEYPLHALSEFLRFIRNTISRENNEPGR